MKRLIAVSIIIITILCFGLYFIFYSKNAYEAVNIYIDDIKQLCREQNLSDALKKTNELSDLWEEKQLVLCLFVRHDDLDQTKEVLARLKSHLENDLYDSAIIDAYYFDYLVYHIYEHEKPIPEHLL